MSSPARAIGTIVLALAPFSLGSAQTSGLRFSITFPQSTHAAPVTGRAFLILSRDSNPEPRSEFRPFLNLAVYDLQAFLDSTSSPRAGAVFHYGRPEKGHGWQHTTEANIVREMGDFITAHAPAGESSAQWKY